MEGMAKRSIAKPTQNRLHQCQRNNSHRDGCHEENSAKNKRNRARSPEVQHITEHHRAAGQNQCDKPNAPHRKDIKGMQLDAVQSKTIRSHAAKNA